LGHLSFNISVDGAAIGRSAGVVYALSCSVIPMGWLNSVGIGIMQEISENLMKFGGAICSNQVFKGRPIPLWMNDVLQMSEQEDKAWYHVYLDNVCAGERIMPDQASVKGVLCHELAERAWESAGVVSSQKKKISAARGTEKITTKLKEAVRREVLQLVLLVPLLHWNLGAGIEGRMVATDASEKGCAVVSSEQLSAEGIDYLQATRKNRSPGASLISLHFFQVI